MEKVLLTVDQNNIEGIIIQHNHAFVGELDLDYMLSELRRRNIRIIITLHNVQDFKNHFTGEDTSDIFDSFSEIDRILVHSFKDLNLLKKAGYIDNVSLFPHGISFREDILAEESLNLKDKFVFGSYGFVLPHKGLSNLIEAFAILNANPKFKGKIHLLLVTANYQDAKSIKEIELCNSIIEKYELEGSVTFVTEFLENDKSLSYLQHCDLAIFPYFETNESASGAVRMPLSIGKRVAVSDVPIFDDVSSIVEVFNFHNSENLSLILENLMVSKAKYSSADIKRYCQDRDWSVLSERLRNMMLYLLNS